MNNHEHFDPYGQYNVDSSFVTTLIEFHLDLIESRLSDLKEYPDANNIIEKIQSNIRNS